jgi:hypothetical protein
MANLIIGKELLVKLSIVAASSLITMLLTGCGNTKYWTPHTRPWDPPEGRQLFEQIPNWDGYSGLKCGGHLPRDQAVREGRSLRC